MRRKLLMLLTMGIGMVSSAWALNQDDKGVYQIGTPQDLVDFATLVNGGTTGANAVLTDNIDLTGVTTLEPIGTESNVYTGTFDGKGKTISNYNYTATHTYNGLFGRISAATIQDFTISGTLKSTLNYCGVIGCADGKAKIKGIHSSLNMTVNYKGHAGGVVGSTSGAAVIDGCSYSGTMTTTKADAKGGILGYTKSATIKNCIFSGKVTGSQAQHYGGILGYVANSGFGGIQNCLSVGEVSTTNASPTGVAYLIGNINTNTKLTGIKNNYYLKIDDAYSGYSGALSSDASLEAPIEVSVSQLKSGEIAYKLGSAFYQTIGTDDYPTLDATHKQVYANASYCCDGITPKGDITYGNTDASTVDDHTFDDGYCTLCGHVDPSYMTPVASYYEIGNAKQLKWFAAYVNQVDPTVNAKLTSDIDLTSVMDSWVPIGDWSTGNVSTAYKGHFDGQGYVITNFTATTTQSYYGIFGVVSTGALIENFTIKGSVTNNSYTSVGVVGYARDETPTISNIHSELHINTASGKKVGGILGTSVGTTNVSCCSFSGIFQVTGTGNYGGIVGYVNNNTNSHLNVTNCLFNGSLTNDAGAAECGGIVGYVGASPYVNIKNCLSVGTVTADVAGQIFGAVKSSSATTTIVNSYYLGEKTSGVTEGVGESIIATLATSAQLASGYVAAKLAPAFRQNLGSDAVPVLDPTHGIVTEISAAGWSTQWIEGTDVEVPSGVTAYAGVVDGNYLKLTAIEDKVKASEAVVLKGDAGFYNFMPTTGAAKAAANDLKGSDGTVQGGSDIYALAKPAGKEVGFYQVGSTVTIPAGKAYLQKSAGVKGYLFSFDENADAISGLTPNPSRNGGEVYDLSGRKVNSQSSILNSQLPKGIYIVSGKKVLF